MNNKLVEELANQLRRKRLSLLPQRLEPSFNPTP
jgi:hypothetical protein